MGIFLSITNCWQHQYFGHSWTYSSYGDIISHALLLV